MARQEIGLGSSANDGTGDPLREAGEKLNSMTEELYNAQAESASADSLAKVRVFSDFINVAGSVNASDLDDFADKFPGFEAYISETTPNAVSIQWAGNDWLVNSQAQGRASLILSSANEAQTAAVQTITQYQVGTSGDDTGQIFEAGVHFAAPDTDVEISIGFENAVGFRVEIGGELFIRDNAGGTSTSLTVGAVSSHRYTIDMTDHSDVKFYIDGTRIMPELTFTAIEKGSATTRAGVFLAKGTTTEAPEVVVDFIDVRCTRQLVELG